MGIKQNELYGVSAIISEKAREMTEYRIKGDTEDCFMRFYHLFPGIDYALTSFNASLCAKRKKTLNNIIEITFCKAGRFECVYKKDFFTYVGEGDFAISILNEQMDNPSFPLGRYEGFAIIIDLNITGRVFEGSIEGISIDFEELLNKFCPDNKCTVIKTPPKLLNVFNDIYDESNNAECGYLRLKVLEIFHILSEFLPENQIQISDYFSGEYTKKVKEIKKEITDNLGEKIYLKQLSEKYDISLTMMKDCFKAVYGKPILSFQREYKMQKATQLLIDTDKKIIEIANELGYANPNKFSTAFKKIIGMTPSDYRSKNRRLFG